MEFNRAARRLDHYSLPWEGVFSAIRGFGFGTGLYRILGSRFAVAFAILITVGQVLAYTRGMRPAMITWRLAVLALHVVSSGEQWSALLAT
jgi:hypothetical protein